MPFFKRPKSTTTSTTPSAAKTTQELLKRRANEYISTLQKYYPRDFAKLAREVENGDLANARLTLRGLGSVVDEAYIEPVLGELQTRNAISNSSLPAGLEANPNALIILLRSGNRAEAIEFYQKETGVDWPTALNAIKEMEQKLARENA